MKSLLRYITLKDTMPRYLIKMGGANAQNKETCHKGFTILLAFFQVHIFSIFQKGTVNTVQNAISGTGKPTELHSSVNQKLTKKPIHITIPSTSSSDVNMMIQRVKYWCLSCSFLDYTYILRLRKTTKNLQHDN
jgi:hypothetical protein